MIVRDRASGVPWVLEGTEHGVRMRTFEERLLQDADHQEMLLLPLRADGTEARRGGLHGLVEELSLRRTPEGFERAGTRCRNTLAAYRALHRAPPRHGSAASAASTTAQHDVDATAAAERPCCHFGAPLVATALQRVGTPSCAHSASRSLRASLSASRSPATPAGARLVEVGGDGVQRREGREGSEEADDLL